MKKFLITLTVLTIISAGCAKQNQPTYAVPSLPPQYNYTHQLKIGEQTLVVEISTTPAEMQQGLSDRISMADDQGMLFDFGQEASGTAFWMKDMKFDLDFIWIAGGKVIGITSGVAHPNSSNSPLPYYYPPQPVNQVAEVNAGWAKKNGIIVGADVSLAQ
jgi:uncharacterized membrane protein (UPF0127 family)